MKYIVKYNNELYYGKEIDNIKNTIKIITTTFQKGFSIEKSINRCKFFKYVNLNDVDFVVSIKDISLEHLDRYFKSNITSLNTLRNKYCILTDNFDCYRFSNGFSNISPSILSKIISDKEITGVKFCGNSLDNTSASIILDKNIGINLLKTIY